MSLGSFFASIDPGPALGKGLASLDKAVNQIPGGWITVGGLAAGGAALAYAPEVMAFAESAGVAPEIASAELGLPAVEASTGAFINPATGLAWEATGSGLAGNGAQLTAAEFASQAGLGEVTAKEILSNASRAKQLASLLSGGSTAKPNAQQFAQFQQANQPVQEQFGGLYRMNQNPFGQSKQSTETQSPFDKQQDFLAQLSEQGKTQPTLADLLRNA